MSAPVMHPAAANSAAALWFSPETVYVRSGVVDGQAAYVICDPDGKELAATASRDLAFALARQNDLDPVSVH